MSGLLEWVMSAEQCFFTLSNMKGRLGTGSTEVVGVPTEGPSTTQQPMPVGPGN